jgi:hypothetical protein
MDAPADSADSEDATSREILCLKRQARTCREEAQYKNRSHDYWRMMDLARHCEVQIEFLNRRVAQGDRRQRISQKPDRRAVPADGEAGE